MFVILMSFEEELGDFLASEELYEKRLEKTRVSVEGDFHERKRLKIKFLLNTCNSYNLSFVFFEEYE